MSAVILREAEVNAEMMVADALAQKDVALAGVALIARVNSAEENEAAAAAVRKVSELIKSVNKAHKVYKEPYLKACQALDKQKREFLAELEAEELRVNQLCGEWRMAEAEKVREGIRQAQAERDRIELEQRETEAAIAEAEAKALAAAKGEERAALEAKQEAERKEREALAAQELAALAPPPAPVQVAGQTVRDVWTFKVTDILSLAKVRPDLVKMEPRTAEINEMINALGVRKLAGLEIFEEARVSTRRGKAIEV